jgi:hypothetical protein
MDNMAAPCNLKFQKSQHEASYLKEIKSIIL